ncbi:MAG TPA: MBL fold metallo-hydrolase [Parvularculaceae bacterium]|nr:MBL fold metallo-hydrolase [Amphiplicatus sp.]HOP19602.1 MBL fold metallo-hydrolase [Amphiplicatus sp.]HPE32674.1 MBL fold metallo-hydrolase [Parvularculaceae bacterium]HRX37911.1 MBL fold metallo-hydrolase [Parvularculaceae bacterium]
MLKYLLALVLLFAAPAFAQEKPLEVEVLRTSAGSLYANIALIKGEKKAVLVDAPFTMADAHRVVAMVLDSGKELETIFVTHDHPDHFFAMEVLTQAFPDAKVVAHPVVVDDIWRSLPYKVKRWSPMLGANGPKTPTAPAALESDTFMLEGHEMKVLGPMQGDHVHATALYVPSIHALFAGDLLYNEMYLWFGEHGRKEIAAWGKSIDELAALDPQIVVAGHSKPGLPNDPSSLAYSRGYIDFWLNESKRAKNSEELRARVKEAYPESIDALGDFLLGNSSKVTMGEEPRWTE